MGQVLLELLESFQSLLMIRKLAQLRMVMRLSSLLRGEEAVVRVGAAPMKTKPVTVKAGQTLLIETNFTNVSICLGTLVVAFLFGGLLRAILLILYIVLMFLFPFYSARIAE